jgi:membrane-bound lytic murein transglycosylase B
MKKRCGHRIQFAGYLLVFCWLVQVSAKPHYEASFGDWKSHFKEKAQAAGITQQILDNTLDSIKLDTKVLELDSSQPEFSKQIWDYLDRATAKSRVKKGIALLWKNKPLLETIEQRYAVPKEIIVAIWAMESEFGENYGHNDVIRSLASLAYHGKRAEFAENELIAALNIYQQREINRLQIKLCYAHGLNKQLIGSWAGAMGQAQFMPSSYLKYALDYDRDGRRDLWRSLPDVFASIANYLKESGWDNQLDWGWEVSLAKGFDWALNTPDTQLSLAEWQKQGVTFVSPKPDNTDTLARLFIPAGKTGPVFLISKNFDVIRKYNKSSSYALAVAQLSRLFAGGKHIQASWPRKDKPLSLAQKKDLQALLTKAGFDAGKIDGKIGENSKRAIHDWQMKQGLAGDGYANLDLLKRLKKAVQEALLK